MAAPHFLVTVGSIRRQRIGPDVAAWVAEIGREALPATFELVDLRHWPFMPAMTLPPGQVQGNPGEIDAVSAFAADKSIVAATLHALQAMTIGAKQTA